MPNALLGDLNLAGLLSGAWSAYQISAGSSQALIDLFKKMSFKIKKI
jgi:hypothetical protein